MKFCAGFILSLQECGGRTTARGIVGGDNFGVRCPKIVERFAEIPSEQWNYIACFCKQIMNFLNLPKVTLCLI